MLSLVWGSFRTDSRNYRSTEQLCGSGIGVGGEEEEMARLHFNRAAGIITLQKLRQGNQVNYVRTSKDFHNNFAHGN